MLKPNQQKEIIMPTAEWLKKYESIKDKLACKTNLDAHFTEKVIGNMGVDVLDIGTVHFPTGTIFACDPLVELEDTPPFIQTIPAGTYPVKICVVPSEKYGDRYACVKVDPKYQGDYGDWLNWTVPDTDCNLPIFASGWGDGYYPVYFGYDAKGEVCAVYVRFIDIEASYKEQA